jgi:predicted nuclease of predicted toxin-antitoxin system
LAALYSNENFPLPVVQILRQLGHDVLTTAETGKAGDAIPDPEVLAFASVQGRALLTLNRRDFIRLHLESGRHHGIIVCTFDRDFQGQAHRIHQAIASEKDLRGKLVRVNRAG